MAAGTTRAFPGDAELIPLLNALGESANDHLTLPKHDRLSSKMWLISFTLT